MPLIRSNLRTESAGTMDKTSDEGTTGEMRKGDLTCYIAVESLTKTHLPPNNTIHVSLTIHATQILWAYFSWVGIVLLVLFPNAGLQRPTSE